MNKLTFLTLIIVFTSTVCGAQSNSEGQFPAGIIYGPKAAFKIDAPTDWILDNQAGLSMGLHCVLYLDGYNWSNSPAVMYAKIASTNYEKVQPFIDFALKEFIHEDPNFEYKEFKTGKINNLEYKIMDYKGGPYKSYERVFYVQMEKAVGFIVFTTNDKDIFDDNSKAIFEVIESFEYMPEYINYKENK